MSSSVSKEDIEHAYARIRGSVLKTPVLSSTSILPGKTLFFKCECLQHSGSFKIRGATNFLSTLSPEEARRGVVTHSSGNHAAAVALAASVRGVPAHIVIPDGAPQCKVDRVVQAQVSNLYRCAATVEAREQACHLVQERTGATFVHPYNDPRTIAGQGTIALEFLDEIPDLDAIIVPISGGGMCSGIAVYAKGFRPSIKIVAAEPCGVNRVADTAQCKAQGALTVFPKTETMADGLQARLGSLTWPIVRDFVDEVIIVEEDEIEPAMRVLLSELKVVVEPSGAVGLAAALSKHFARSQLLQTCQRIGVILCGGNLDLDVLARVCHAKQET